MVIAHRRVECDRGGKSWSGLLGFFVFAVTCRIAVVSDTMLEFQPSRRS